MASLLRWYQGRLAARPLLTQAVTTAFLFGTGDVMAQQLVEKKGFDKHELARTARMVGYGGLVFGPAATIWFGFLSRKVVIPGRPNLEILARVGLDQCLFASTNMLVFLSTMATLEGGDPKEKLRTTYFPALAKNWMLWPPVQAINFKFVPLEHRVFVVNIVSLGWNCYLSYLNSGGGKVAEVAEEVEEKGEELVKKVKKEL